MTSGLREIREETDTVFSREYVVETWAHDPDIRSVYVIGKGSVFLDFVAFGHVYNGYGIHLSVYDSRL